jgi:hypothetical protein
LKKSKQNKKSDSILRVKSISTIGLKRLLSMKISLSHLHTITHQNAFQAK